MASRWIRIATLLSVALFVTACSSEPPVNPCTQFEVLRSAVDGVDDLDPATTTTGQAREISNDILTELRRFETAADGLFGARINDFRSAVNDIQRLMVNVDDDTLVDAWGPLLSVAVDVAQFEFTRLSLAVRPACRPASPD